MTRHLGVYWAKDGVRVNCLSPGPFPGSQAPAAMVERLRMKSPMGRMRTPSELKGPLVFLASDASSYVTGQNLIVDGRLDCVVTRVRSAAFVVPALAGSRSRWRHRTRLKAELQTSDKPSYGTQHAHLHQRLLTARSADLGRRTAGLRPGSRVRRAHPHVPSRASDGRRFDLQCVGT